MKELREWLVAVGTIAMAFVAAWALRAADQANKQTLQVMNGEMTPWLSFGDVAICADTSSTSPSFLRCGARMSVQNYGQGPALEAEFIVTSSLGYSGSMPGMALMPKEKEDITVPFVQKARDTMQLRQWRDSTYLTPGAWLAVRVRYRRLDEQVFEMTDTNVMAGRGQGAWRGLSIRQVSQ